MRSKERVTYEETYRKGAANIRKELLPESLPYMRPGTKVVSMGLERAGVVEIDGEELEFQVVRVISRPPEQGEPDGPHS